MSTRAAFDDEDLPPVLRRLIAEGRLRDYVLIELYATLPLSLERLVVLRIQDMKRCPPQPDDLCVMYRGKLRRAHLDSDGLFAIDAWIQLAGLKPADYLFPSARAVQGHLCSRQARRIIEAQFHEAPQTAVGEPLQWQDQLATGFRCRLSRWPWVDCVKAQSGERCISRCEGGLTQKPARSFRTRGVLPTPDRGTTH